ncbi:hypothetical protein L2E82_13889 [Cichorium intybus]|uniref:Uncharacterized protein n=1 Tax=Cichorium intybus TaxID=13427 RepID=A0ACB9EYT7_CICIN|nr:hypothetical protein L1887_33531 [Cichorium endivia]KAI3763891.1 hypothetical protein L2E82_13889 [Cichorium intybus]
MTIPVPRLCSTATGSKDDVRTDAGGQMRRWTEREAYAPLAFSNLTVTLAGRYCSLETLAALSRCFRNTRERTKKHTKFDEGN